MWTLPISLSLVCCTGVWWKGLLSSLEDMAKYRTKTELLLLCIYEPQTTADDGDRKLNSRKQYTRAITQHHRPGKRVPWLLGQSWRSGPALCSFWPPSELPLKCSGVGSRQAPWQSWVELCGPSPLSFSSIPSMCFSTILGAGTLERQILQVHLSGIRPARGVLNATTAERTQYHHLTHEHSYHPEGRSW